MKTEDDSRCGWGNDRVEDNSAEDVEEEEEEEDD
jgi:hypothetical protein